MGTSLSDCEFLSPFLLSEHPLLSWAPLNRYSIKHRHTETYPGRDPGILVRPQNNHKLGQPHHNLQNNQHSPSSRQPSPSPQQRHSRRSLQIPLHHLRRLHPLRPLVSLSLAIRPRDRSPSNPPPINMYHQLELHVRRRTHGRFLRPPC